MSTPDKGYTWAQAADEAALIAQIEREEGPLELRADPVKLLELVALCEYQLAWAGKEMPHGVKTRYKLLLALIERLKTK